MIMTSEYATRLTGTTDSPATHALMAGVWAVATILWVAVSARMRPNNSSFGWRALSMAVLVCCGAQCSVNVLGWSGDLHTAAVIDFVSKLLGLVAMIGAGVRVVTVNRMRFWGVGHRAESDVTIRHSTPIVSRAKN